MEQHPVPQNILDIEFKLFSKFTIKEFAYIAIGGGFGFIFIYAMSSNPDKMPPIIAIPVFIISLGIGLFLALVPINDQKADVYFKNYISAITNPTLRVWRSKYFKKDDIKTVHEQGKNFGPSNVKKGANLNIPKTKLNTTPISPSQSQQELSPQQQQIHPSKQTQQPPDDQQLQRSSRKTNLSKQPQLSNQQQSKPVRKPVAATQLQHNSPTPQRNSPQLMKKQINANIPRQLQPQQAQSSQHVKKTPSTQHSQQTQFEPAQPQPIQPTASQQFQYKPVVHNLRNTQTTAPKPQQLKPKPNIQINNPQNSPQRARTPQTTVPESSSTPPKVEINKNLNNKNSGE